MVVCVDTYQTFLNQEIYMKTIIQKVKKFVQSEEAVSAVEYALILALIAAVIIVAVRTLGTNISTTFSSVAGVI